MILSEAALQVVLAASLKPGAKRIDQPDWKGSVWSATWKPLVFVLTGVVIAGFVAQGLCPQAARLAEVIQVCI